MMRASVCVCAFSVSARKFKQRRRSISPYLENVTAMKAGHWRLLLLALLFILLLWAVLPCPFSSRVMV